MERIVAALRANHQEIVTAVYVAVFVAFSLALAAGVLAAMGCG